MHSCVYVGKFYLQWQSILLHNHHHNDHWLRSKISKKGIEICYYDDFRSTKRKKEIRPKMNLSKKGSCHHLGHCMSRNLDRNLEVNWRTFSLYSRENENKKVEKWPWQTLLELTKEFDLEQEETQIPLSRTNPVEQVKQPLELESEQVTQSLAHTAFLCLILFYFCITSIEKDGSESESESKIEKGNIFYECKFHCY